MDEVERPRPARDVREKLPVALAVELGCDSENARRAEVQREVLATPPSPRS